MNDRKIIFIKFCIWKAFLGIKVLMTCFNAQLTLEWPRVARCIREISDRVDGGPSFWNFLVFVATQRGPLYLLILPLMWHKVIVEEESRKIPIYLRFFAITSKLTTKSNWPTHPQVSVPVESGSEQILQDLLRQKLIGSTEISPLPAGELMEEFHAELSILSNEFIHQRGEPVIWHPTWLSSYLTFLIIKRNEM